MFFYAALLLSSQALDPSLSLSPQTVDSDRDQSGPDRGEPSSERNYFSSLKPRETKLI